MAEVYEGISDVPWYLTLGNHDCRAGVDNSLDLTKIYEAWYMPASYHNKTFAIDDTTNASFLYLNSCTLFCVHWEPEFDHRCEEDWAYEEDEDAYEVNEKKGGKHA